MPNNIYNSLLLGMGGGVISRRAQSRQYDDAATVAIGIGGTGIAALRTLKQKVYQQLIPDNPDAAIPEYGHIRFLAIDSDDTVERGSGIGRLLDREYFPISNPNLKNVFKEEGKARVKQNPLLNWMEIDEIEGLLTPDGAGGVRQIGRYLLMNRAGALRTRIEQECTEALRHAKEPKLDIYIFAGISGGTGSGCFIDTCYIVRDVLGANGWAGSSNVMGFFFLPDVVTSKPEVAKLKGSREYNETNGYAAMKELDYLSDLHGADDWFDQNYGSFRIRTQDAPVDMCHLISATQADGSVLSNAFGYCVNVAADYVMAYLADVEKTSNTNDEDDGGITLRGHLANVNKGVALLHQKHGAKRNYHVVGAANAEIPIKEILTYLAAGFSERFQQSAGREKISGLLTKAAVDGWAKKLQADAGAILRGVGHGCPGLILPDMDLKQCRQYGVPERGRVIDPWSMPGNDYLVQCEGKRKANAGMLGAALQTFDIRKVPRGDEASLLARTYGLLYDLSTDPDYGPYYALEILHNESGGYDLRSAARDAIGVLQKQRDAQNLQLHGSSMSGGIDQDMAERAADFVRKPKKKQYAAYREAVLRHYMTAARAAELDAAVDVLRKYLQGLEDLYTGFFGPLAVMLDGMRDTFRLNSAYLANPANTKAEGYTKPILSFDAIKPKLSETVAKLQPGIIVREFVQKVLESPDEWLANDDEKIGRFISSCMEEIFQEQVNLTMNDYLKIRFPNAVTEQQLQDAAERELIRPIYENASAMFWCDPNFEMGDPEETYQTGTYTVPAAAAAVCTAAMDFRAASETPVAVRKSDVKDRIFAMRFFSGIPFYAYKGVRLMADEYNAAAGTAAGAGAHLYAKTGRGEAGDGSGQVNWRTFLPTPAPYSLYPDMTQDADAKKKLYEDGISRGIIRTGAETGGKNGYVICISPDITPQEYKKEDFLTKDGAGRVVFDEAKLENVRGSAAAALRERREGKCIARTVALRNDGDPNLGQKTVEAVRLDYFLHFPRLEEDVRAEIQKQRVLERELEMLDGIRAEYKQYDADLRKFSYMIFYRLIRCLGGMGDENFAFIKRIVCTYTDSSGEEKTAVFADPGMDFGNEFPIYQAFLTYRSLDPAAEPGRTLDAASQEKIAGLKAAGDHFAARKLDLVLNRDKMAEIRGRAAAKVNGDDIIRFYAGLRDEINSFKTNFSDEIWTNEDESTAAAAQPADIPNPPAIYHVYDMNLRRYLIVDPERTLYYGLDSAGQWVLLDPSMLVWVNGQWAPIHLENSAFVKP